MCVCLSAAVIRRCDRSDTIRESVCNVFLAAVYTTHLYYHIYIISPAARETLRSPAVCLF